MRPKPDVPPPAKSKRNPVPHSFAALSRKGAVARSAQTRFVRREQQIPPLRYGMTKWSRGAPYMRSFIAHLWVFARGANRFESLVLLESQPEPASSRTSRKARCTVHPESWLTHSKAPERSPGLFPMYELSTWRR